MSKAAAISTLKKIIKDKVQHAERELYKSKHSDIDYSELNPNLREAVETFNACLKALLAANDKVIELVSETQGISLNGPYIGVLPRSRSYEEIATSLKLKRNYTEIHDRLDALLKEYELKLALAALDPKAASDFTTLLKDLDKNLAAILKNVKK